MRNNLRHLWFVARLARDAARMPALLESLSLTFGFLTRIRVYSRSSAAISFRSTVYCSVLNGLNPRLR